MSDTTKPPAKQIKVTLPAEPPKLTPAVARGLLALLIELYDEQQSQTPETATDNNQPAADT